MTRFKVLKAFTCSALLGLLLIGATAAHAVTYTWIGPAGTAAAPTSGTWETNANWSPNTGFPSSAADTAILGGTTVGSYTVTQNADHEIGSYTEGTGARVPTLSGAGNLTVDNNLTWTVGTMSAGATTTLAGGGTLTLSGASTKTLSRTLTNNGTGTFSGGGVSGAGIFNNAGSFTINNSATFAPTFNNTGTATKQTLATTSSFSGAFNNTGGTVNANTGIMSFNNGGTSSGSFAVALGATLRFQVGTYNLNAGTSFTNAGTVSVGGGIVNVGTGLTIPGQFTFASGIINVNSALTSSGTFDWTGGTLQGAGGETSSGTLNISGATTKTFKNTFNAQGTTNLTTDVLGSTGSNLNNTGTFNVTGSTSLAANAVGQTALFTNAGTLNVNAASTFTDSGTFTQTAAGSVAIANTGTVTLSGGGGSNAGAFNPASGGTLQFASAFFNLNAGTSFTNAGTVLISSGTVNVNTPVTLGGTFTVSGGATTLNALSALTSSGTFNWTGGTLQGAGGETSSGTLNISGATTKTFTNTLNTQGTTNLTSGSVLGSTSANLNNTGIFNATGGTSLAANIGGQAPTFTNGGTLNVGNAGTVGTFSIVGNYTQTTAGILNIDISATSDQLPVTGVVTLAGTLNLNTLSARAAGDSYTPLSGNPRTGTFSVINGMDLGTLSYKATYGSNDLTLLVTDASIDYTAPVPSGFLNSGKNIRGTATDATTPAGSFDITGINVAIRDNATGYWNGTDFTSATPVFLSADFSENGAAVDTWRFFANGPALVDGHSYTIYSEGVDNSGSFTITNAVTVVADTVLPTVDIDPITSPTTVFPATFSGHAADARSGVSDVRWILSRFDSTLGMTLYWTGTNAGGWSTVPAAGSLIAAYTPGTGVWTAPNAALGQEMPSGANLFSTLYNLALVAHDNASNTSVTARASFIYDVEAPTVSIRTPVDGTTVSNLNTVKGIVADNVHGSGVASVTLTIQGPQGYWNGAGWQAAPFNLSTTISGTGSTKNWQRVHSVTTPMPQAGDLDSGQNYTLQATATDALSNSATSSAVTVTYMAPFKSVSERASSPATDAPSE